MKREEAIELLCAYGVPQDEKRFQEALDMAIEALQREGNLLKSLETNEPIYDMVDVVRCKDCRKTVTRPDGAIYCEVFDREEMSQYGYCNWGERKGGDDE